MKIENDIEKEVLELAIDYLSHPDVNKINFALPVSNIVRALRIIKEEAK